MKSAIIPGLLQCNTEATEGRESFGEGHRPWNAEAYVTILPLESRGELPREKRSLSQNNLLWKWNTEVAEQLTATGADKFTDEEVHEWLKDMYCPAKPVTISGMTRYVKSTRRLDIGEMHKYLTDIDHWAHQKGLRLTIPDSCEYRELQRRQNE